MMKMHLRVHGRSAVLAAVACGAISSAAWAWTPRMQSDIAGRAAELAPPDLRRQLERHEKDLRRGALEAFRDQDPSRHVKNGDGSGTLDRVIIEEANRAIEMIRAPRTFAEIAYQLGRLSHFVADAINPLNTSQDDPAEGRYFADYLFYMESAEPRFAPVFYGLEARFDQRRDLSGLASAALLRGRVLYPAIGREYGRTGSIDGRSLFDDRSTAFGVAAVSYSHALSDAANAFRFVWLHAGGADPRPHVSAAQPTPLQRTPAGR
jgi:hypothetical protein